MKSKSEPAVTRIKMLLEVLSPYTFSLYYLKDKDLILSDFFNEWKDIRVNLMGLFPYHLILMPF